MKLLSLTTLLAATATAYASLQIGFPTNGASFRQGEKSHVQVVRPGAIEDCTEVGIVIDVVHCGKTCPKPGKHAGYALYKGPFKPTHQKIGGDYENFTVTFPESLKTGKALLTLTNKCRREGESQPSLEYTTAEIKITERVHAL
ncbi:hypothetical protein BV22DRAFT_1196570 [Leucogyrophana mollusca]|uniref:Uncharacterized protein n=1 Tax=Leucogyrophana mollusca TaxID=85980 RepID=A0ACB8BEC7_9AGAM|nr:hypothetical protein BV22DRAFT_1196570 [Leucogyrophana mollusca]